NDQPGTAAVGNEGFLSGNDVVIAITSRQCAHRTQVAADARFAHGDDTDQLTADHARKPLLFLLFTAISDDIGRDDFRMSGKPDGGRVGPRKLLDHDGGVAKIATGAAVLFRNGRTEQPQLAGLEPDLLGHDAVLFPLMQVRHNFAIDETPGHFAEHIVVFAENATHHYYS